MHNPLPYCQDLDKQQQKTSKHKHAQSPATPKIVKTMWLYIISVSYLPHL